MPARDGGLCGGIDLHVILISNSPTAGEQCPTGNTRASGRLFKDLTAPIITLINTRQARGQTATARLRSRLHNCPGNNDSDRLHWFRLRAREGAPELPLGWALSEPAIREMQSQLFCRDTRGACESEACATLSRVADVLRLPRDGSDGAAALGLQCVPADPQPGGESD